VEETMADIYWAGRQANRQERQSGKQLGRKKADRQANN
jgi:hypothetical protein